MLLSKAVTAILIDFLTAQDLSNEYASQISRKYKQYRNGKENILNNFDAPASVLKEIELELKFTIRDLDDSRNDGLDVEETWGNCRNIADEVLQSVIPGIQNLINTIIQEIPQLVSSDDSSQPILRENIFEASQNSRVTSLQDFWRSIKDSLDNENFKDSVKQKIIQKLFKTAKSTFLRGTQFSKETIQSIIVDKLEEGILDHPDTNEVLKRTEELNPGNRVSSYIQDIQGRAHDVFTTAANNLVHETEARTLIQKFPEFPHAEVMLSASFLRDLPPETISSLKITTKMESYQWVISESGESLHKVRD